MKIVLLMKGLMDTPFDPLKKRLTILLVCLFLVLAADGIYREQKNGGGPPPTPPLSTPVAEPTPKPSPEPPPEPPPEEPAGDTTPQEPIEPVEIAMDSPHFAFAEFMCDCGGRHCSGWPATMDRQLIDTLEHLRTTVDAPIIITSGVRCPLRNQEVGGIPGSYHLSGEAADLYCPQVDVETLAATAETLGLDVIRHFDQGYIHVE